MVVFFFLFHLNRSELKTTLLKSYVTRRKRYHRISVQPCFIGKIKTGLLSRLFEGIYVQNSTATIKQYLFD